MIKQDMRFDESIIKSMIGKEFKKYRCDRFDFTNSVTQIVGVYLDDSIYKINNEEKTVDYFGTNEDVSVFTISECSDTDIRSAFDDTDQIDNPVKQVITNIKLLNEHQSILENGMQTYDVYLTRAIIFCMGEYEIMFEKDTFPFSEEISIYKGYKLVESAQSSDSFLNDWDETITPYVERDIIVL